MNYARPVLAFTLLALVPWVAQAEENSQEIGCDRAGELLIIDESSHLDPSCVYTAGVEITSSDVVLDCRGARIFDEPGGQGRGILIAAPVDEALENVTVRNCEVEGFLNNLRVSRTGWKGNLEEGSEYDVTFSNIVVEDSTFLDSDGSGIFVNAFVTGVTLRRLTLRDSEGVGVYLEAGSKDNVIEECLFENNGFDASTMEDVIVELGPLTAEVDILGREGLAIDGSRYNVVRNNVFKGNAAGGIFLYKNCGEYVHYRPDSHWERLYGADGNLIEGNTFIEERDGIWVGSRMAQNQRFMDCSDPAYIREPFIRIHRDVALDNTLLNNTFLNVDRGIRVEDDGTWVEGNLFNNEGEESRAIVVGSKFRTDTLGEPVLSTTVVNNQVNALGRGDGYSWIHGHEETVFEGNYLNGEVAELMRGKQPPMTFHLFVESMELSLQ